MVFKRNVRQRPIFPGRRQPSIFGARELNFRVRDGYGCILAAKAAGHALKTA